MSDKYGFSLTESLRNAAIELIKLPITMVNAFAEAGRDLCENSYKSAFPKPTNDQ